LSTTVKKLLLIVLTKLGQKQFKMCTAVMLMHHRHAAETTLPLITAAATQRRSLSARDSRTSWRKAQLRLEIFGNK